MYDHYFSNSGRPPVLDDLYAKIQPKSILNSGEEHFYMGIPAILVNELWPF